MSLTSALDKIIAELPDAEDGESVAPDLAPPAPQNNLLAAFGWPDRYLAPEETLSGGEWLSSIALAHPVVEAGGILILHGKRGAGKTRMAAELARSKRFPNDQRSDHHQTRSAVYRTAMRFFLSVRATFKKGSKVSEMEVIDQLIAPGLLVLDELQERGETAFEDRLLTHLIDARYGARRSTILIANLTKEQLGPTLGPSIVDRASENGKRIDFTWDSYRRATR